MWLWEGHFGNNGRAKGLRFVGNSEARRELLTEKMKLSLQVGSESFNFGGPGRVDPIPRLKPMAGPNIIFYSFYCLGEIVIIQQCYGKNYKPEYV